MQLEMTIAVYQSDRPEDSATMIEGSIVTMRGGSEHKEPFKLSVRGELDHTRLALDLVSSLVRNLGKAEEPTT